MDSIGGKGFACSLKLAILGQLVYELKNKQWLNLVFILFNYLAIE